MFDLYLITDPSAPLEVTRRALAGAPAARIAVQLRAPEAPAKTLLTLGEGLRAVTREAGVPLLVNRRIDIAHAIGADGVHLPERGVRPSEVRALLGAQALVGVSTHDRPALERAVEHGASFAVLGPFGPHPTKGPPLGAKRFAELRSGLKLPVYALGGVDLSNAREAIAAGASGLAVIRAVYGARDPAASVRALLRAIDEARKAQHATRPQRSS